MQYRNKKTGEIHVTVDGSQHDQRLAANENYEKVSEKVVEKAEKQTGTEEAGS